MEENIMDTQKKLDLLKTTLKGLKEKQKNLGEFGMTSAYISLLNDYSFVIDSIENGIGNKCRPEHEDAEEVLAELRDSFSSEQYGDKTYDLKSISEFEREVFWAIESLERILTEE